MVRHRHPQREGHRTYWAALASVPGSVDERRTYRLAVRHAARVAVDATALVDVMMAEEVRLEDLIARIDDETPELEAARLQLRLIRSGNYGVHMLRPRENLPPSVVVTQPQ